MVSIIICMRVKPMGPNRVSSYYPECCTNSHCQGSTEHKVIISVACLTSEKMQQRITTKSGIRRGKDTTTEWKIHFSLNFLLIFNPYLGHLVELSYPKCPHSLEGKTARMKHCGSKQPPHQDLIATMTCHLPPVPQKTQKSWKSTLRLDIIWYLCTGKYLYWASIESFFLWLVSIAIHKASLSV